MMDSDPKATNHCAAASSSSTDVSLDEVRGSLGSLLLLWSDIELSVRREIARRNAPVPKPGAGFVATFGTWIKLFTGKQKDAPLRAMAAQALRVELEQQRKVRNGICHCLTGYSATSGATPATLTWTVGGADCSITYQDLQARLCWLSRVPRAMSVISGSPFGGSQCRLTDNPENRTWWSAEFGIDLRQSRAERPSESRSVLGS